MTIYFLNIIYSEKIRLGILYESSAPADNSQEMSKNALNKIFQNVFGTRLVIINTSCWGSLHFFYLFFIYLFIYLFIFLLFYILNAGILLI